MSRSWIWLFAWLTILGAASASSHAADAVSARFRRRRYDSEAVRGSCLRPGRIRSNRANMPCAGSTAKTRSATLPAEMQWISRSWNGQNAQMPYLAYLSERDRLLMLVECGKTPIGSALITSDDHGKTWSPRRWLSLDKAGKPNAFALGLTYLGQGKLLAFGEDLKQPFWFSSDYGQTWQRTETKPSPGEMYAWDPLLVVAGCDRPRGTSGEGLLEADRHPLGIRRGGLLPSLFPLQRRRRPYLDRCGQGAAMAGRQRSRHARCPKRRLAGGMPHRFAQAVRTSCVRPLQRVGSLDLEGSRQDVVGPEDLVRMGTPPSQHGPAARRNDPHDLCGAAGLSRHGRRLSAVRRGSRSQPRQRSNVGPRSPLRAGRLGRPHEGRRMRGIAARSRPRPFCCWMARS